MGEAEGEGFASEGENSSWPGGEGMGRAMKNALRDAGLIIADISYICAHATSTPLGDMMEARNILAVFGERPVPVSSTKSLTGHELWMSGAAQVVDACLLACKGSTAADGNFG